MDVNMYFIYYKRTFSCVNHVKPCNMPRKMRIQEFSLNSRAPIQMSDTTIWMEHSETDWHQFSKRGRQDCMLFPYLFNLYVEYILKPSGLEDTSGITTGGRNINNLH